MTSWIDIPLKDRVWMDSRIHELRDQLSLEQRKQLLVNLKSFTWAEWMNWFVSNIDKAELYASSTAKLRKTQFKSLGDSALLIHHAAMFLTALLCTAKDSGFPQEYINRNNHFDFDLKVLSVSIRAWDDIDTQFNCSLFWLFDEPEEESVFKD